MSSSWYDGHDDNGNCENPLRGSALERNIADAPAAYIAQKARRDSHTRSKLLPRIPSRIPSSSDLSRYRSAEGELCAGRAQNSGCSGCSWLVLGRVLRTALRSPQSIAPLALRSLERAHYSVASRCWVDSKLNPIRSDCFAQTGTLSVPQLYRLVAGEQITTDSLAWNDCAVR